MTKEQRHRCMSLIRGKDTKPELLVRRYLFASGFRFRVNVSSLPGTPDIVLKKYNTVVFVNGCFWHGHYGCRLHTVPKSNTEFWQKKIDRNRRRDAAVAVRLEARGWYVATVWECSLDSRHRERTLSDLKAEIIRNGEKSDKDKESRRLARLVRRQEKAERKSRLNILEKELTRYNVPGSIRQAAISGSDYECDCQMTDTD